MGAFYDLPRVTTNGMSALDIYKLLVEVLRQNPEAFAALVVGFILGLFVRISKRHSHRVHDNQQIKLLESSLAANQEESKAQLAEIAKLRAEVSVKPDDSQRELLKVSEEKVTVYERLLKVVEEQDGNIWIQPAHETFQIPTFVPYGPRRRAVIISFFNLKGGVGKTTLTSNLGVLWAQKKDVLMIDLDYQQSLTTACVKDQLAQLVEQERVINHVWQPGNNMNDLKPKQWWTQVPGHSKAYVIGVQSNLADLETRAMVRCHG